MLLQWGAFLTRLCSVWGLLRMRAVCSGQFCHVDVLFRLSFCSGEVLSHEAIIHLPTSHFHKAKSLRWSSKEFSSSSFFCLSNIRCRKKQTDQHPSHNQQIWAFQTWIPQCCRKIPCQLNTHPLNGLSLIKRYRWQNLIAGVISKFDTPNRSR